MSALFVSMSTTGRVLPKFTTEEEAAWWNTERKRKRKPNVLKNSIYWKNNTVNGVSRTFDFVCCDVFCYAKLKESVGGKWWFRSFCSCHFAAAVMLG